MKYVKGILLDQESVRGHPRKGNFNRQSDLDALENMYPNMFQFFFLYSIRFTP